MTGSLKHRALTWLRDGRHGVVCWTPDFMGFGNVLYVLHWAAIQRENGNADVWVLQTGACTPWLSVFPELRTLLVSPTDVRFRQARVMPWSEAGRRELPAFLHLGGVPSDPRDPFGPFLRTYLLPGAVRTLGAARDDATDRLVVNVRRGDYYSDPDNRRNYGFPVATYLAAAVPAALEADGPVAEILVVSDDPDWCRDHLGFLAGLAPRVTYRERTDGPVGDFFELVRARRLVMTNSTFSYWAAMLGNTVHGDNHAQVWAPRFFDRSRNEGRSGLVDERWSIVEEIPGGWDLSD